MIHSHLVPVHDLALEIAVDFVQVKPVASRNEALRLEDVGPQFVNVPGCSRIVPGALDTAGECSCLDFEALDIVRLPAMHAEMEIPELLQHFFRVDADGGISLFRQGISLCRQF